MRLALDRVGAFTRPPLGGQACEAAEAASTSQESVFRKPISTSAVGRTAEYRRPALGRSERQRNAVQAMALSGWAGAIVEDVPQVSIATRAMHFGSGIDEIVVDGGPNSILGNRLIETRPTRAAIVFSLRSIKIEITPRAMEDTCAFFVIEWAAEWTFRALFPHDVKGFGRQQLAPLRLGLHNLIRASGR